MEKTYCGKSCGDCDYREKLNCPGCKAGPGCYGSEACEIGVCARTKATHCTDCPSIGECTRYRGRHRIPKQLEWAMVQQKHTQRVEAEVEAYLAPRLPVMTRWLPFVFWAQVVYVAAYFIGFSALDEIFFLRWPIFILQRGARLAMGVFLLKMAPVSEKCHSSAGVSTILLVILYLLTDLIPSEAWPNSALWAAAAAQLILELGSMYYCWGNGIVMYHVDEDRSRDWNRLWLWYRAVWILRVVSVIAGFGMWGLYVYIDIAVTVMTIGIHILSAFYLRRSEIACWVFLDYD